MPDEATHGLCDDVQAFDQNPLVVENDVSVVPMMQSGLSAIKIPHRSADHKIVQTVNAHLLDGCSHADPVSTRLGVFVSAHTRGFLRCDWGGVIRHHVIYAVNLKGNRIRSALHASSV